MKPALEEAVRTTLRIHQELRKGREELRRASIVLGVSGRHDLPVVQLGGRVAITRAREGFARYGTEPSAECLEGAAA